MILKGSTSFTRAVKSAAAWSCLRTSLAVAGHQQTQIEWLRLCSVPGMLLHLGNSKVSLGPGLGLSLVYQFSPVRISPTWSAGVDLGLSGAQKTC